MSACPHSHVDDTTSPDIDSTGIELLVDVLFGRNVRSRATKTSSHVSLLLPRHSEAFTVSKIGDFDRTVRREEKIFGLQIAVGDTHFVHVFNASHQLLEKAVGLNNLEL